MTRSFFLLLLMFLAGSCATIMNTRYCTVKVDATTDSVRISIPETQQQYNAPATIALKRSRKDILMLVSDDSVEKELILESHLSPSFYIGNLFGAGLWGFAIDFTNQRRFTYPHNITIDLYAEDNIVKRHFLSTEKGRINLNLTVPMVNQMLISHNGELLSFSGFYGFAAGMEFYQSPREYFSFHTGIASQNFGYSYTGVQEGREFSYAHSSYFILRENYRFNHWHAGLGLGISRLMFTELVQEQDQFYEVDYVSRGYGFSVIGGYNFANNFFASLHYQPVFINYKGSNYFDYQHTISLEITLKIKLRDSKSN